MRTEDDIRKALSQIEFDRNIDIENGIDSDKFTREDLLIITLKWVLGEIEYPLFK